MGQAAKLQCLDKFVSMILEGTATKRLSGDQLNRGGTAQVKELGIEMHEKAKTLISVKQQHEHR